MEIFNGLQPGEAVGWIDPETAETRYAIKLPNTASFNGVSLKTGDGDSIESGKNGQIILPGRYDGTVPEIIQIVEHPGEIRGAWDRFGQYHDQSERRRVDQEYNDYIDEDGQGEFVDLDTEYRIKKQFSLMFNGVTIDRGPSTTVETPLDIKVIGWWEPTGSDFIVTPFQQGSITWRHGTRTGIYKVRTSDVVRNEIQKWVNQNLDSYQNRVDGMDRPRFLQIDGQFVLTEFKDDPNMQCVEHTGKAEIYTSLDEAHRREQDIRKRITGQLNAKVDKNPLQPPVAHEIIESLSKTRRELAEVESKAKTQTSLNKVKRELENTLEWIRSYYDK